MSPTLRVARARQRDREQIRRALDELAALAADAFAFPLRPPAWSAVVSERHPEYAGR